MPPECARGSKHQAPLQVQSANKRRVDDAIASVTLNLSSSSITLGCRQDAAAPDRGEEHPERIEELR